VSREEALLVSELREDIVVVVEVVEVAVVIVVIVCRSEVS
jgi:hypothetical protein